MPKKYTPTAQALKVLATFPRERIGEPRGIDPETFDRAIARIKADAVREFARSIDLEATADEWSTNDHEHWAAGNAASSVQVKAHDYADKLEADHE